MQNSGFPARDWIVVALLGLIAMACGWVFREFAQDDAFITYRYARNIARGYGFVYNRGEQVLGTTTPLYTLWLALVGKVSGQDIRVISHWTSILSLWFGGSMLYFLGKCWSSLHAVAISLIFVTNPLLAWSVGMETCFFNLFLMLVLTTYVHYRMTVTGVLLGLLVLIRYEAALLALVLAAYYFIKCRRLPWELASGLPLFSAWTIFAWRTFGSIIPQSASAKLIAARVPFIMGATIYWRLYVNQNQLYLFVPYLLALGGYSTIRVRRPKLGFFLILIWSIIYFIAASILAGSFPWYYGPLIPGFAILAVSGTDFLIGLSTQLLNRLRLSDQAKQPMPRFLLVGAILALTAMQVDSWRTPGTVHLGRRVDPRYIVYKEIAAWLNQNAQVNDTLAAAEIGVLGYYTDMKIIDLYGLVTPELKPRNHEDIAKTLGRAITLYRPDFVVAENGSLSEHLERYPGYQHVQSFGDGAYVLYKARRADT